MVEFIANWFANDVGVSPLILTRGYGGADEAKMLQRHFNGSSVKIGVGANRAATASSFLQKHGSVFPHGVAYFKNQIPRRQIFSDRIGVAILDDGMQHISMCRNLEIVMVNALSPWGNHRLLPLGPLREPLASFSRADAAILHHADLVPEKSISVVESTIRGSNQFISIFRSKMIPSHFFKASNVACQLSSLVLFEKIALCVSAIGSPDSFVQRILKMGPLYVDRLDYSDHHKFQNEDIEMIKTRLGDLENKFGSKPTIVMTEKDYDRDNEIFGKLDGFEVLVLCCKLEIIEHNGCSQDSFKKLLNRCLI